MKRNYPKSLPIVVLTAIVLVSPGCAEKDTNQAALSGTVKLDGKPLEDGSILLSPIKDTKGKVTGGRIKNGRYDLSGETAVAVGWNRVEIRALRNTGKMVPKPFGKSGELIEERVSAIASRFNTDSILEADVQPGINSFDFEVASE